jgi:hypothetical protein
MLRNTSILVAAVGLLASLSHMPSGDAAPGAPTITPGNPGIVIQNSVYYDTYL